MGSGVSSWLRGAAGGVLMGLANLVPGISGGTMLLATGVYKAFVDAIANLSSLRWKVRSFLTLAVIGISAVLAIVLLAGPVKSLVETHRWTMFSLFIGLTLGGVPLVWRLAKPVNASFWIGSVVGFALMAAMAFSTLAVESTDSMMLLIVAGVAGASAMVLPGVSGAYMLLILGQYERILGAVEFARANASDMDKLKEAGRVLGPVAIGVVLGIVVISNLVKTMLERWAAPTLGFLLGLLVGSVLGIYPFQVPVSAGQARVFWTPNANAAGVALILVVVGYAITVAIDRVGSRVQDAPSDDEPDDLF